ncbi:MAG: FAD:protein FMN transferase [Bacteroidota bacterium]
MNKNMLLLLWFLAACQQTVPPTQKEYQKISGQTMGVVTYNITYDAEKNYQHQLDSLMNAINNELSTYVPSSAISSFNRSELGLENIDQFPHFLKNTTIAMECAKQSEGAFDPTVMPLVNYWGFGYTGKKVVNQIDQEAIDSLLQFVGMEKVKLEAAAIQKKHPSVQFDFSGSAKGYFIDEVSQFLVDKGVKNYMVEIGGEGRTLGKNPNGKDWRMGVNVPREQSNINEIFAAVTMQNEAIATSGNYRNYYVVDEKIYSHTINPHTGLPERSNLLSVSIVTQACIYADAYATACMVMGFEKAKIFVDKLGVEAYFIYNDEHGTLKDYATAGLQNRVERFLNKLPVN